MSLFEHLCEEPNIAGVLLDKGLLVGKVLYTFSQMFLNN